MHEACPCTVPSECIWQEAESPIVLQWGRKSTLGKTAVGGLGYEALPHKLFPVCMTNSMALVPLDHSDGQIGMRRPCC